MATEITYTPGEWRGPETNNLQARRDAANALLAEQNRARQSGSAQAQPEVQRVTLDPEITKLVHAMGISNQPESYAFVQRFLNMERDLNTQGMLIIGLQTEVSALKAEIIDLKRKKGYPIKAETR